MKKRLALLTAVIALVAVPVQTSQAARPDHAGRPEHAGRPRVPVEPADLRCVPETDKTPEQVTAEDLGTHFADGTEVIYDAVEGPVNALLDGAGLSLRDAVPDAAGGTLTLSAVLLQPCPGGSYAVSIFDSAAATEPLATATHVSDGSDHPSEDRLVLRVSTDETYRAYCVWTELTALNADGEVLDSTGGRAQDCDAGGAGGRTMF